MSIFYQVCQFICTTLIVSIVFSTGKLERLEKWREHHLFLLFLFASVSLLIYSIQILLPAVPSSGQAYNIYKAYLYMNTKIFYSSSAEEQ